MGDCIILCEGSNGALSTSLTRLWRCKEPSTSCTNQELRHVDETDRRDDDGESRRQVDESGRQVDGGRRQVDGSCDAHALRAGGAAQGQQGCEDSVSSEGGGRNFVDFDSPLQVYTYAARMCVCMCCVNTDDVLCLYMYIHIYIHVYVTCAFMRRSACILWYTASNTIT